VYSDSSTSIITTSQVHVFALLLPYKTKNLSSGLQVQQMAGQTILDNFSMCSIFWHVQTINSRYLPIHTNTTVDYVLSDELHGDMFRPLGGHLQAIKIHKRLQLQL
jgi:hypothetical protein